MRLLVLFIFGNVWGITSFSKELVLPVGGNHTIHLEGVTRVAVGTKKIIRVRALSSQELLVTARKEGESSLRIWAKKKRYHYRIRVLNSIEYENYQGKMPPVVRVSLEFLELESNFLSKTGIQWPPSLRFGTRAILSGGSHSYGLNYSSSFHSAEGFFQFLVEEGMAKVLAKPEIFVGLGEKATFHAGGEFPVATTHGAYGQMYRRVEWKPYGMNVTVFPQMLDGMHFKAKIEIDVSEVNVRYQVGEIPSITKRKLDTLVHLRDGETIVLSGLSRMVSSKGVSGLKGLQKIPILGGLFAHSSERNLESEMLMALNISLVHKKSSQRKFRELRDEIDF